jgi:PAS domain S-box-containing protein
MTWKLIRSYSALLLLFLGFVVTIQLVGIPGTSNRGTFDLARSRTFDSLELVSGLLSQRLSTWSKERRIDVGGLASQPLFLRALERGDPLVQAEIDAFLLSHPDVESVSVVPLADAPPGWRRPGAVESLELQGEGDASRLRLVRRLFSLDRPDHSLGVLVAECAIGRAALPFLSSVNPLKNHDWDCVVAGPQGQPVFVFAKVPRAKVASFEPVRLALAGTEGPYDGSEPDHNPVLAFGRRVDLGEGLALALVLSVDRDRAYSTAVEGFGRLLGLWGVIFIGILGLSFVLARQISRPLLELAAVARRIESGDLGARAAVRGGAEIDHLAQVFNGMVTRLQARHEDQIRVIGNNITGGMVYQVISAPDGTRRFTWLSDSVKQLYGVSPEEAIADAQRVYGRLWSEDVPRLIATEEEAIAAMSTFRAQVRVRDPGGTVRWSSLVSTPTRLDDGSIIWDGIEFVITDQKLAQERIEAQLEEIREKESEFHTLADSGLALIWRTDNRGLAEYFNLPWLRFTGRTLDQEKGNGWMEGVHPDDLEVCTQAFEEALKGQLRFEVEYRLRNAEGEYRWIADRGTPRFNGKGEFLGYIGHSYDITDRRRAAETLQRNEKLESLGVLAGGIAHDFNNLLAGVFAYLQLARESAKDVPVVVKHLDKALSAFQRAKDLTRQLLTFAKGGDPVRQTTDLPALVEEAARFALSGASVTCEFDWEPGLWPCDVDGNQISQVIDNLVINALQAMPLGGKLVFRGRNQPHSQPPAVKVTVEDSGIGIAPNLLPRIFDPFFTTKQKGTGLGLATAFSIMAKHGGTIDVESVQGKGTAFFLTFPASPHALGSGASPAEPALEHAGSGLVVFMDDEDMVRDLAAQWLESLGYQVLGTRDGDETLAYFAGLGDHALPVCVFLDLTVPGGRGGRETLERLRPGFPDLPIFASSGYSEDPVMARPSDFGFTGSIAKPYLKDDLIRLLNRYVGPRSNPTPP